MPPDITAGLMALVGQPPGPAASGKPSAEPPGTTDAGHGLLKTPLFASILAETGKSSAKPPELPQLPQLKKPAQSKTISTPLVTLRIQQTQGPKPPALNTWRTMDILPKLSLLVTKNTKDQADELPHHKESAAGKAAAVKVPADVPEPVVQAAVAPPILPVPWMPLLIASAQPVVQAPRQVTPPSSGIGPSSAAGLILPRTFAVSSMVAASAAPPSVVTSAPALPVTSPPMAGSLIASSPITSSPVTSPPVTSPPIAGPAASKQTVSPTAVIRKPLAVAVEEKAPPAGSSSGSLSPGVSLSAVMTDAMPEAVAAALAPSQEQEQAAPLEEKPDAGKSVSQMPETTLKPTAPNADINTRISDARISDHRLTGVETPAAAVTTPAPLLARETTKELAGAADLPVIARNAAVSPKNLKADPQPMLQASAAFAKADVLSSKPLSAADRAEIARQTADGLSAVSLPAKPGAVQQITVQLHPKDWGSLQVSVTVKPGPETGAANTVTAHILAETPQVKAALQSQNGALHQALKASGLNLERLTVSVKPPAASTPSVTPAPESASAGFTANQGQSSPDGQPNTNSSPAQSGQSSGSAASGSPAFGGSGQGSRQGHPPPFASARIAPEPEEFIAAVLPSRPVMGRLDTHA